MLTRARILLLSDSRPGGWQSAPAVARAVMVHPYTVRNVRRRFVAEGLEAALEERARPGPTPKFNGEVETRLTLLACSQASDERAPWTPRLAGRMIELGVVDSVSHSTVAKRLKKTRASHGGRSHGASASPRPLMCARFKTCWRCTIARWIPTGC